MITKKQTIAENISEALGDDGMVFEDEDGKTLEEMVEDAGGSVAEYGNLTCIVRYDFDDGSSIIDLGSGWDLGLSQTCFCCHGCGHGDGCHHA